MVELSVRIEDERWPAALADLSALADRAIGGAARHLAAGQGAAFIPLRELTVLFGDDAFLRRLNGEFRGKDKPTNILSFTTPLPPASPGVTDEPGPPLSGDMALAYETVAGEAADQGKTLADHVTHLIVHGFLHILGHDHETPAGQADMEALEIAILADMGVSDPYSLPSNHISDRQLMD